MEKCSGDELHEHYSLNTQTYIAHRHIHDMRSVAFNNLHHHAPEDHHIFTAEELANEEQDTGRKLDAE
jgi:hypothetical protein